MEGFAALSGSRTDEHDVSGGSAALFLHLGDRMLDEGENTVEVDGNRAMPLLVGHAVDGGVFGRPDPVVGNHYVETSEGRDGCGHQLLRRCAGGKVRLHGPAVRGTTFADEA